MKSITNYIDELKEKVTGSDYKTAQLMGVERTVIAKIRKRGAISDENAVKVAHLLGIDPGEVLIAAAMARSEGEVKEAWLSLSKRAGIAASIMLAMLAMGSYPLESKASLTANFDCQKYTLCEVNHASNLAHFGYPELLYQEK
jgi:hypothetical protein